MIPILKTLAILVIVLANIEIFGPLFRAEPTRIEPSRPRAPHIDNVAPNYRYRTFLGCLNLASITLFVVDAFRRKYEGPRARALGFALGGYFTLGLSSLIYYLFWGWRPLQLANEVYGSGKFCADCIEASTVQAAPDSEMYEIGIGSVLLGNAKYCPNCKARIKTLWAWYIIPLCPLGSYRIIPTSMGRYVGRRTELYWWHVIGVYVVGLSLCGPIFLWLFGIIHLSR